MDVRPLVFSDDPASAPLLYACGKCRMAVPVRGIGGDEAKRRAEACCVPLPPPPVRHCACGEVLHYSGQSRCNGCANAATIAAAEVVEDDGEPVCIVGSDTFFNDIQDAVDDHAGQWAHPCERVPLHVNAKHLAEKFAEDAQETMCEEAFEDAGDHVEGIEALTAAIEAALVVFNAAQTSATWNPDTRKIVRVPGTGEAES